MRALPVLRFSNSGRFTILQLTDMHLVSETGRNATTFHLLHTLIERETPDLLAFTGDIVCSGPRALFLMEKLNRFLEPYHVPYTFTFGNHESDGGRAHQLSDLLETFPLCAYERGDPALGCGNYALSILGQNGAPVWRLYHMDCSSGRLYDLGDGKPVKKEAYPTPAHIAWLRDTHCAFRAAHGACSALLFHHVPLPEFNEVWMFDGVVGDRMERVFCPPVNSGLFSELYALGDFRGVFAGHDHVNSYHGSMLGILLAYGRNSGYQCACEDYFKRGGRVIVLDEPSGAIAETRIVLHDGSEANALFAPPPYRRFAFFPGDTL